MRTVRLCTISLITNLFLLLPILLYQLLDPKFNEMVIPHLVPIPAVLHMPISQVPRNGITRFTAAHWKVFREVFPALVGNEANTEIGDPPNAPRHRWLTGPLESRIMKAEGIMRIRGVSAWVADQ